MALNSSLSSFAFKSVTVSDCGTASVSLSRPPLESTSIGAKSQSFIAGVGGATASLDIYYDQASTGHVELEANVNNADAAQACTITMASGQSYAGNAYVTGFEVTAQAGSLVRASVQLQFTTPVSTATILTIT